MVNEADTLNITRARIGSVVVYEVKEDELDILESGSPASLLLNFAILFVSIGLSFFATLLLVEIPGGKTFTVFVIITVVALLIGAVLMALWYRDHRSNKNIVSRIRGRYTAPLQEEASEESESE